MEASNLNFNIPGYNSLCSDHPSNTKGGALCMFYKNCLCVIRPHDLCALTECIVSEIKLWKKTTFFTSNYRSSS